MATRRLLLAASALSGLALGCSKSKDNDPPPGNPKGTFYDAGMTEPVRPLPGNPKGTFYDAGMPEPTRTPDAPTDASTPDAPAAARPEASPRDAGAAKRPVYANTKGSRYDDGLKPE